MDPSQITYIGKTDFRNSLTQFGIRAKDRLRHMYIIGKSGTGKTTLIENMIVQDIYNGNGVAFIDPHGESADKLLKYIPSSRINDLIYFNPGDSEFPIAFNPMEISDDASAAERSLITDGLMTVFKKIWPDAFSGRMEYILNNTMLALLEYPEPNLLGITRMLTDKEFRKKVIAVVQDPTVRNAWDELMKWDDKRWSEAIGALVNKIGQFTTNPVVRNIIGQSKSTFSFRQVMDDKKILIMNMSKGLIGDQSAALLGAMLITKIYLAGMSRANLTAEELERAAPLYFYVDEFQNFANESFANILSEARKYKLALTVANQYITQMEETIRDAVFGNMGTTITFRVGPLDAEFIERVYTPVFNAQDLQNIAFGQIFLTLLIDGLSSKPFSAVTLLPIEPKEEPQRELVIETSRKYFAKPRQQVEEKIMAWFIQQRAAADALNKKPNPTDRREAGITGAGASRNFVATPPVKDTPELNNNTNAVKEPVTKKPFPYKPQQGVRSPIVIQKPVSLTPYQPPTPKETEPLLQGIDTMFTPEEKSPEKPIAVIPKIVEQKPIQVIPPKPILQTPPKETFIPKNTHKNTKTETKKSLVDLLQKVKIIQDTQQVEKKAQKEIQKTQLTSTLHKYYNNDQVRTKDQVQQKNPQPVTHINRSPEPIRTPTTHQRLHSIFSTSAALRGSDDLPSRDVIEKPKEVPEDVLKSIFQT